MLCGPVHAHGSSNRSDTESIQKFQRNQNVAGRFLRTPGASFIDALKTCRDRRDLEAGKGVHRDILRAGEEYYTNIVVCNILLSFYARCGCTQMACGVFDSMRCRNEITWNSIIQGYAQNGHGLIGLSLYKQMQEEAYWIVGQVSILAALKACSRLSSAEDSLQACRSIHRDAAKLGHESELFVASRLVDLYARCGATMFQARQMFESMPETSASTWNSLLHGYASRGDAGEALNLYNSMCESSCPDAGTFVAVLRALGNSANERASREEERVRCLERCRVVHGHFRQSGMKDESNMVENTLVDAFAKCGSMRDARGAFQTMRQPDVVSWNCLISGYVRNGNFPAALELLTEMKMSKLTPDWVTFLSVLKACAKLGASSDQLKAGEVLQFGKCIHAEAVKMFEGKLDLALQNALLDMYSKCGSMDDARHLLQTMEKRDVISWTSIILEHARRREWTLVLRSFDQMREEGIPADDTTSAAAIKACTSLAEIEEGQEISGKLVKVESLERGKLLHLNLGNKMITSDAHIAASVIDMYSKCGSMADARGVFESFRGVRDSVLWNCLISGYASCGENHLALESFTRLLREEKSPAPDVATYVVALKACAALGALETGRYIHSLASNEGFHRDSALGNSLVSFYGRCSSMSEAEEVFTLIAEKSVVSWSALMAGYSLRGDAEHVFRVFEEMKEAKVEPDDVSFLCVLAACSHAGLVDEAREFFQEMVEQDGVVPGVEHYTCLVDLLGRADDQLHEEAFKVARTMPGKADAGLWIALLDASRRWRNEAPEVRRAAFDSLLRADDRSSSGYILLSNALKM